jgi:membrane protease subunit (stomatin/prohibitin family)
MTTSRQSKGFIELEWICPNCNSRNRGPVKTCQNCGAPQPENVQFYAPAEAKVIQDENAARLASLGPDIHCAFCGTRNPANATTCSQCGADLKEGKARQAGGEVARAPETAQVTCANCGEVNPAGQTMCARCGAPLPRAGKPSAEEKPGAGAPAQGPATKRKFPAWVILGGVIAFLAVICIGVYLLFAPSKTVNATVSDVYWQTAVPLQEIQAVRYSDEAGSPPAGAYDVSCHEETQQVCVEKTIDKGNGYAEVVQECHDETTQYCSYTLDEWKTVQTFTLEGHDLTPVYARPSVAKGQRLGGEMLTLTVFFSDGRETYSYTPESLTEFQRFAVGSSWTLHLNALGGVVEVESNE